MRFVSFSGRVVDLDDGRSQMGSIQFWQGVEKFAGWLAAGALDCAEEKREAEPSPRTIMPPSEINRTKRNTCGLRLDPNI